MGVKDHSTLEWRGEVLIEAHIFVVSTILVAINQFLKNESIFVKGEYKSYYPCMDQYTSMG